jgi:hypothetical protein
LLSCLTFGGDDEFVLLILDVDAATQSGQPHALLSSGRGELSTGGGFVHLALLESLATGGQQTTRRHAAQTDIPGQQRGRRQRRRHPVLIEHAEGIHPTACTNTDEKRHNTKNSMSTCLSHYYNSLVANPALCRLSVCGFLL